MFCRIKSGGLLTLLMGFRAFLCHYLLSKSSLYEQYHLWVAGAGGYCNLGHLEDDEGNTAQALHWFEASVELCERGLDQLVEREYRDVFKSGIESAHMWLIEYYAHLAETDQRAVIERLVSLLESTRRIETLAGFGEITHEIATWYEPFQGLMNGIGDLSNLFHQKQCAFLWVHATHTSVVFVILTSGHSSVEVVERSVLDQFGELLLEVPQAIGQFESWRTAPDSKTPEMVSAMRKAFASPVEVAGERIFNLLPDKVKNLLAGDDYKTVFLAPCGKTINLPVERLRLRGAIVHHDCCVVETVAPWTS